MKEKRVDATIIHDRFSYLWLVVGAILLMLSTGQFSVAFAAWAAPIFLIRFFRTRRVVVGYFFILLVFYIACAIAWRSIINFFIFEQWIPYLLLVVVMALNGSLAFLADRLLAPRLKGFTATLVYPLTVTTTWYLYNLVSPMGSFGTTGYEQYTNQALTQLVSITGIWGLIFLVSWLGPVVNWAWERSFSWPAIRRGAFIFISIVSIVLLFGSLRLMFFYPQSGTVRVHGFSLSNEERASIPDGSSHNAKINDLLIDGTVREAQRGAQIVLWQEMAGGGTEEDTNALIAKAKEVAKQQNIYIVMGVGIQFPDSDSLLENRLMVIDPSGEIIINHLKYGATMISNNVHGDGIMQMAETPYGTLTGIICYDADFPITVNQAGHNGADILFLPNGDPNVAVTQLHAQQAIFRSIENGVSLVRQDYSLGWSIATDPYGRILAAVDNLRTSERVMVAQVPTHRVFTLYSILGDYFAWLSVAGFVTIMVYAIISGRKRTSVRPPV